MQFQFSLNFTTIEAEPDSNNTLDLTDSSIEVSKINIPLSKAIILNLDLKFDLNPGTVLNSEAPNKWKINCKG